MRFNAIALSIVCVVAHPGAAQVRVDPAEVVTKVLALRPTAQELRWRSIPWAESLAEARRASQKEKRPLFFWGCDDLPLDRC